MHRIWMGAANAVSVSSDEGVGGHDAVDTQVRLRNERSGAQADCLRVSQKEHTVL